MFVFEERLMLLEENCEKNQPYLILAKMASKLIESLQSYKIIEKIDLAPNDLLNGSISIYITTMPKGVVLKIWHNSNMYYLSFFKKTSDNFDEQLRQTFNESGIMPAKTIEEAEERVLDFLANEVYNRDTRSVLT